jgi:hypothetical protein
MPEPLNEIGFNVVDGILRSCAILDQSERDFVL